MKGHLVQEGTNGINVQGVTEDDNTVYCLGPCNKEIRGLVYVRADLDVPHYGTPLTFTFKISCYMTAETIELRVTIPQPPPPPPASPEFPTKKSQAAMDALKRPLRSPAV